MRYLVITPGASYWVPFMAGVFRCVPGLGNSDPNPNSNPDPKSNPNPNPDPDPSLNPDLNPDP